MSGEPANFNARAMARWLASRGRRHATTSDAHGASAQPLLDLDLLREVFAPRANGACAADNSMGRRSIERPTAAVRSLHEVRPEGRELAASRMGGHAHRVSAIPVAGDALVEFLRRCPVKIRSAIHLDQFD